MRINTTALIRSATASIWFVALTAVGSELYAPMKNFFVSVAAHHWTGKSVFAIGIFVVLYLVMFKMKDSDNPERVIKGLIVHSVLGGLFIFGYFAWHYLSA